AWNAPVARFRAGRARTRRDLGCRPRQEPLFEVWRRLRLWDRQAQAGDDRLVAVHHLRAPAARGQVALEPRELGPLQDAERVQARLALGVNGMIGRGLAV